MSHLEINPGDEFLIIKSKKKVKKIKKQFAKEFDEVLLDVVDRSSFDEYKKDVLDWRDLRARAKEESD